MRTHTEKPASPECARTNSLAAAAPQPLRESSTPAFNGHSFSRISVYDQPLRVQRVAAEPDTAEPAPEASAESGAVSAFIVEDEVGETTAGQMRKTEFLAALREAMCRVAEAEAGAVCPGIGQLFEKYGPRSAAEIEGLIRRYISGGVAGVTDAKDYIPPIEDRTRRAILIWKTTGEVTGIPPGFESGLPVEPPGAPAGPPPAPGEAIARKAREGGRETAVDSPAAIQNQLGAGRPLDSAAQARFGPALGMDLSAVRIHTDPAAARVSDRLDARAFTVGRHVAFAQDEFQPGTPVGDALLAHELAHVAQQSGAAKDVASHDALEADADQSAVGAVMGLWGNLRANTVPALKSGLRLQRCTKTSSGPIGATRYAEAKQKFRDNNSQLSTAELDKIDSALTKSTDNNLDIIISFYDYFTKHDVVKVPSLEAQGLDGDTKPDSDMKINPKRLDPGESDTRLGATLLHEYSHTRHDTNWMGSGDYQEGDSYGIEYFFAERKGETARTSTIVTLVSTPGKLSMPSLQPAIAQKFKLSYASLVALYEVIDGKTPRAGLTGTSKADASRMSADLIDTKESSRPADLVKVMNWVGANLSSFTLPIP